MRTIVVGDIHGCLEEFDELLRDVEFKQGVDRLILAGDLVDRGPDSAGVVRRAMEIGAESVMGNHEETHLRFRKHLVVEMTGGKKNPMAGRLKHDDFRAVEETVSAEGWEWLAKLPAHIHIDDRWTVVHAGCFAGIPIEKQDLRHLCRLRYVRRATGKMAPLDEEMGPETHAYWTELWTGPRSIVYGHHVEKRGAVLSGHSMDGEPSSTVLESFPLPRRPVTLGIDTGCAFGGSLTAAVFDGGQVRAVSVTAKGKWAELHNEKGDE